MGNWLQLRDNLRLGRFRSRAINFNQWAAWNYDGDRLFGGFNVNGNLTWRSNWVVGGGFNATASASTTAHRAAGRAPMRTPRTRPGRG